MQSSEAHMENPKMKLMISLFSAAAFAAAFGAQADTRSSDGDKRAAERKASPSAPKQDEEQAEAHSQPNNPHPQKKGGGASTGSSAPAAKVEDGAAREQAFRKLDLDGDGSISKAEAAGNAAVMNGFDRADRNRDGKLSRAEYDQLGRKDAEKPRAKARTKAEPR